MHPIEPYARQAYAAGWAASGGPMTERVKAGCAIAVALAAERADDPTVFEVTLDLGRLEGLWALLFQRRQRLVAHHAGIIRGLWKQALAAGIVADAVHRWRDAQAAGTDDRATAEACAAAALAAIPSGPDWVTLRQALRDALAAGRAEGAAGAAAVTADGDGEEPDWDGVFDATHGSLAAQTSLWADAQTWAQHLLKRGAMAIGRALHRAGADSVDHLVAAARVEAEDAADTVTDWAVTGANADGSLDWYQQQDTPQLTWVTAGDGRVCAQCQGNEDASPYPPDQFPELPAHLGCRCVPTAN